MKLHYQQVSLLLACSLSGVKGQKDWEYVTGLTGGFLPRSSFGAAWRNNTGYLFGGVRETDFASPVYFNDLTVLTSTGPTTYRFNIATTGAERPSTRARAGFAVSNRYALVVGGTSPSNQGTPETSSIVSWLFDFNSNTWTDVSASGPSRRTGATVVSPIEATGNKFYVHGGLSTLAQPLSDYWEYDADTKMWTILNPAGVLPRFDGRGAMVGNQSYFHGGSSQLVPSLDTQASTTRYTLNPNGTVTVNIFNSINAPARRLAGYTAVGEGNMIVLTGGTKEGGTTVCGNPPTALLGSEDTFIFKPSSASWRKLDQGANHSGVIDGGLVFIDPYVLLVGGYRYECDGQSGAGQVYESTGVFRISETDVDTPMPTVSPTVAPVMASTPAPAGQDSSAFSAWSRLSALFLLGIATVPLVSVAW